MKITIALVALFTLATVGHSKKQYQPSEKVLNQMMAIEFQRYQNMFGFDKKENNVLSLAQTAPIFEATVDQVTQKQKPDSSQRINNVYSARASYISYALLNDAEYIPCLIIWAMIAAILIGLAKLMRSVVETKQVTKEKATVDPQDIYSHLPEPKSLSQN